MRSPRCWSASGRSVSPVRTRRDKERLTRPLTTKRHEAALNSFRAASCDFAVPRSRRAEVLSDALRRLRRRGEAPRGRRLLAKIGVARRSSLQYYPRRVSSQGGEPPPSATPRPNSRGVNCNRTQRPCLNGTQRSQGTPMPPTFRRPVCGRRRVTSGVVSPPPKLTGRAGRSHDES